MKPKIKLTTFLFIFLISIGCSSSNNHECEDKKIEYSDSNSSKTYPIYETNYPLTDQYFQQFLNSEVEFCNFTLMLSMESEQEANYNNNFEAQAPVEYDYLDCVNKSLSDIIVFDATYGHYNGSFSTYNFDLPKSTILPLFDLVLQDPDYFLNAEEYGGSESLSFVSGGIELGFRNFFTLKIGLPDANLGYRNKYYALTKGWNPPDAPPAELVSVIEYFENTIFPFMLEQPSEF